MILRVCGAMVNKELPSSCVDDALPDATDLSGVDAAVVAGEK